MRTFDLAPLYRSTVGFDRLFSLLDQVAGVDAAPSYPPYNIERTGENAYRISLAVAGFTESDLSIETKENTLTIRGERKKSAEQAGEMLYQGIAARAFERRFSSRITLRSRPQRWPTVCSTSISFARSPSSSSRARFRSATTSGRPR
jgi:hypothetical protein